MEVTEFSQKNSARCLTRVRRRCPTVLDPFEELRDRDPKPLGDLLQIPQRVEDLLAGAPEDRPVLVAMIVKPAASHAFGLTPEQDALVQRLMKQRPVVLACLGVEGALDHYTDAAARIVTHSDVRASQRALADRLAPKRSSGDR